MKYIFYIIFFSLVCCTSNVKKEQGTEIYQIALTPPMGWNSYNTFGIDINEEKVINAADAMVESKMADAGYEYIVIDDGWQIDRDENGKIIADSVRFPNGIKHVVDYVHSKGLKFGIYTDLGTLTCGSLPGSYGYEKIDAQTYADWGVDFIKADWCNTDGLDTRTQYKIMSDAIKATGRPMLFSICEWGISSPWEWAKGIGSMWRTTNDIQDCFDCVRSWGGAGWVPILEKNVDLAPYAGPGYWNDPDMLEVGNRALNPTECRSHFSMWCMLAAPLMAGNDLSKMNDTIKDILTAPEIIAIDQDPLGVQGTRVRNEDGLQVWQKPLQDGSVAVALLNITDSDAPMYVTLEEIGFKMGKQSSVRDLWKRKDLDTMVDTFKIVVETHGVVVLKIKGEKAPVSELKFNQPSVVINKGNHNIISLTVIPSITPVSITSSDENIVSVQIAGVNKYRLKANTEGECEINAVTSDGRKNASCKIKVVPSNIPAPWKFDEINDNKASATYDDGVFNIEAGGNDIWGSRDQFGFLHQNASNDSYISAHIISQTNSHPWAKTGLMFRESVAPDSRFVMLCLTPGNGISIQWRDSTAQSCNKKDFGKSEVPVFFKLAKTGSTFVAYKSLDELNWKKIGEISLGQPFPEKYQVGMEVVSHSSHMLNESRFDQVDLGLIGNRKL